MLLASSLDVFLTVLCVWFLPSEFSMGNEKKPSDTFINLPFSLMT